MAEYPTNFESIYTGGYSNLNPNHSEYFSGARLSGQYLGQAMLPTTPNQLGEVVKTIKSGTKNLEVQALGIQGDTDQGIPKQHFKEMKAIMKLSGVKPSLHGPILDAVGLTKNGINESERVANERRFVDVIEKAHMLDDEGNIPVVLHASAGYPGTLIWKRDKDGNLMRDDKGNMVTERGHVINRETGQMAPIEDERKFRPEYPDELEKGHLFSAEKQAESINKTEWDNQLIKVAEFTKQAEEVMGNSAAFLPSYRDADVIKTADGKLQFVDKKGKPMAPFTDPREEEAYRKLTRADQFLENAELSFVSSFGKAYKYGTKEQQSKLKDLSKEYRKDLEKIGGKAMAPSGEVFEKTPVLAPVQKARILEDYTTQLREITADGKKGGPPKLFTKVENFVIDKSAETFGNVAFQTYKKFGEKAPIIALENIDPERGAIVTGEQLRDVVKKTRENFVEQLMEKEHLGKGKAKEVAEKLVGATWDVGHLNQNRKFGMTEKELIKQTAAVAKMVKHVHLTDNFGFADSHLVPGMGNVPIKEHLAELEKAGVLGRVKTIVEAGGWANIIQGSPQAATLSAFGSPIYGMNQSSAGYWNQASGTFGGYFGGYGTINPSTHHSIYGAGLTALPMELGGTIPGGGSRFSGNSMA
jgi:sugar phosphate isomerase/epimerase